jgi:hypothetical protein
MSWYKYYSLIDKFGYQNVNINNNKINKLLQRQEPYSLQRAIKRPVKRKLLCLSYTTNGM